MAYESLEALVTRLNSVYKSRGSLDCLLTIGAASEQVTIAVWNRNEPWQIEAPVNLKWVKGNTMYVRVSRSPSNGRKNTWMEVTTLEKAVELQRWDRIKPENWDLLQHATNIDDPHNTRGELAGGDLAGPLKLSAQQPIGPDYAASQKFVSQYVSDNTSLRFEYKSNVALKEHILDHMLDTTSPVISVYVANKIVMTEVEVKTRDQVIVRFPYAENCEVGIA